MKKSAFSACGRLLSGLIGGLLACAAVPAMAQAASVYYVCPGNVFTNTISEHEAKTRGCKAREAQLPTTIAAPKPRPVAAPNSASPRNTDARVDPAEQKARDTDARTILQNELSKEEAALEALKREYNNGEPERRGEERNFQKYMDRTAELKASIARKEADIASLRRELQKLSS
jgi:hypothetical protein